MRQLFRELKRRNVYKVGAAYLVVAFGALSAVDLLIPSTTLPAWANQLLLAILIVGFPVALVIAWAFELTPEGMERTAPEGEAGTPSAAQAEASPTDGRRPGHLPRVALLGLGLVGAIVAGGWYLVSGGSRNITDRSVAVLPFETLGDTASSSFTEGLHNDLLTRLQRVSELTVIARPSVIRYEDTDKPLAQVAEELNARWIVTAAVQESGNRVQVNPRLIDPQSGTERWSDSYRGELSADQVFGLQEEITRNIADALEAELATGERERLEGRPTEDLEAYRLYVRGRQQLARRRFGSIDHVEQAVQSFRRAIERDSGFALAWAGLADAAAASPRLAVDSMLRLDVEPDFAARRALELDPDLAEAHASMGHVHLRSMDAPAARRELQRATDLKPSYWEAHHWLGELYLKVGQAERALDHLELALELNPQHALARHLLYDTYNATGQLEESLEEARRQQELGLEGVSAVAGEVRALTALSRFQEARRLAEEQVADLDAATVWGGWFRAYLAEILTAQGDTARARAYVDELRAADAPLGMLAWAYAGLGWTDEALEAYRSVEGEDWGQLGIVGGLRKMGEEQPAVRDDPRYRELIRRINLHWGLDPDGSFPFRGRG